MDFRAFEATPGVSVIVLPDAPLYTLVAVSNDFVTVTGMKRQDVVGNSYFKLFPTTSKYGFFIEEQKVQTSFEYVIRNKEPHHISLPRYDVPTLSQKFWRIHNAPMLSD